MSPGGSGWSFCAESENSIIWELGGLTNKKVGNKEGTKDISGKTGTNQREGRKRESGWSWTIWDCNRHEKRAIYSSKRGQTRGSPALLGKLESFCG